MINMRAASLKRLILVLGGIGFTVYILMFIRSGYENEVRTEAEDKPDVQESINNLCELLHIETVLISIRFLHCNNESNSGNQLLHQYVLR